TTGVEQGQGADTERGDRGGAEHVGKPPVGGGGPESVDAGQHIGTLSSPPRKRAGVMWGRGSSRRGKSRIRIPGAASGHGITDSRRGLAGSEGGATGTEATAPATTAGRSGTDI